MAASMFMGGAVVMGGVNAQQLNGNSSHPDSDTVMPESGSV